MKRADQLTRGDVVDHLGSAKTVDTIKRVRTCFPTSGWPDTIEVTFRDYPGVTVCYPANAPVLGGFHGRPGCHDV